MALYESWVDFWMYPSAPQYANKSHERLNSPAADAPPARRVTKAEIAQRFGAVEATLIGTHGEVVVWTQTHVVWVRKMFHADVEVLLGAPRNPVRGSSPTWSNFIIHPQHPQRVSTRQDRLDVSRALTLLPKGGSLGEVVSRGGITVSEMVTSAEDELVAMYIDEHGDVTIWTKRRVWILERNHGMEKLLLAARTPREPRDW